MRSNELRLFSSRNPAKNPHLWAAEAIYKRRVESELGSVDIYVLYFAVQFFPFHVWDYEPVLVYWGKGERDRVPLRRVPLPHRVLSKP